MGAEDLGALLRQFIDAGREGAIEEIVARTRPRLLAAAKGIGAPQDAEDSVQTAYLALVRLRQPLDAPVLPWLLRAVIRIAYRRKAIERRQNALARRLEVPREEPSASAVAVSAEERTKVREQIDRLPGRYRDVLVLYYLEGLATPEIAELQELPESTVRTRLRRGRELLRGPLAPEWKFGLLVAPWFAHDAAAAMGGLIVKKKIVVASIVVLLALGLSGGFALFSTADRPASSSRASRVAGTAREVPAEPGSEQQPEEAEFEYGGPSATGIVLDPDGQPVEGALVRVHAPSAEVRPRPLRALFELESTGDQAVRTGSDGSFQIRWADAAAPQALLVEARGLSPGCVAEVRSGEHVVVQLERAGAISGFVRDIDGRAVAGASVAWWVFVRGTRVERSARTDEAGRYKIEDLPSPRSWSLEGRVCTIAVQSEGFAPVITPGPPLSLDADEAQRFDVWLTRGSMIEGRVVDVETREPLPGASVVFAGVVYGGTVVYEETRADSDGAFELRSFPVDGFHAAPTVSPERIVGWIRAEAEGHAPSTIDVRAVEQGKKLPLEVCCWPTATVRGRVTNGAGHPIAGVDVSGFQNLTPRPSHVDGGASWLHSKTEEDGTFVWSGVPALRHADSPMQVSASQKGWAGQRVTVEVRAGETTTVPEFVFQGPPQPSVIAEVVDQDGDPVPGASVGLHPAAGAQTGSGGRARIFVDAVRECRLAAYSPRSGPCVSKPFFPSVDDPPVVRVVLDATHAVEGTVQNRGKGAVVVAASQEDRVVGHANVDRSGHFRVERLPPGTVDLVARASGREGRATGVAVGKDAAVVVLPPQPVVPTVQLDGTVRDAATGRSIPRFTAVIRTSRERLRAERVAPGNFRFDTVPEGRWSLVVTAPGYGAHSQSVEVRADQPSPPISIDLRAGATIVGAIENRSGVSLMGATFALVNDRGVALRHVRLSAGGRFQIEGIAPGRCWLAIRAAGNVAPLGSAQITVEEAANEVEHDVVIVAAGTLCLTNADKSNSVTITDAEGRTVWVRSDPPANLRVNLPHGAYVVNGRRAEVVAGHDTKLDLGP